MVGLIRHTLLENYEHKHLSIDIYLCMDWERLEVDWERLEKDQQIQLLVDHMDLTVFRAMSLGIHVGQYSLST